jgi:sulfatase maturation enzyme AslB (radical SAM superfamily)
MTDDCNFNCTYCYQKKGKKYLDVITAKKAVDFFFPFLTRESSINFYGGEPRLAFAGIKDIVNHIQTKNMDKKKTIHYSISTNGSLINDEVLEFLNKNKFSVLLSFDGLAQEISKKKGSFAHSVSVMEKLIASPDIVLETNSVFTAETVGFLSRSAGFIIERGVPTANLSFSSILPWDRSALLRLRAELTLLRKLCLSFYRETGAIPVANFRKSSSQRIFGCYAGKDRMDLSPDGDLWGCCLFFDYFKDKKDSRASLKYCFGSLESFMENHERVYPEILENYSDLRLEFFFTPHHLCALCDERMDCVVCPVDAALGSSFIGKIPDWVCRIRRISREEKNYFLEGLKSINPRNKRNASSRYYS